MAGLACQKVEEDTAHMLTAAKIGLSLAILLFSVTAPLPNAAVPNQAPQYTGDGQLQYRSTIGSGLG